MQITHWDHRPQHIYCDGYFYFITGGTVQKQHILTSNLHKDKFCMILLDVASSYSFILDYWVVLNNHYHLILEVNNADKLGMFINRLHAKTALEFNNLDKARGRRVWYQYWDVCIRNEEQYIGNANYILWNPVKHGYVDVVEQYKHSSFYNLYESDIATINKGTPELLEKYDKF